MSSQPETLSRASSSSVEPAHREKYVPTPWSVQRFYRGFVRTAIVVGLVLGFSTGAGMLLAPMLGVDRGMWWLTHSQAHGTAQLFGWTGLFTMGVAFHVVPRFRNGDIPFPWPQRVALWVTTAGVVLRFLGQVVSSWDALASSLVVMGAVLILIGITAFAFAIGRALMSGSNERGPVEKWIWAGAGWAVIAAVLHLSGVASMVNAGAVVVSADWQRPFIMAALLGFAGNFIFGVSTRAVVAFLALRESRNALLNAAFLTFNIGLAWHVVWERFAVAGTFSGIGTLAMALGMALFVVGVRVLEPSRQPVKGLPGTYFRYTWFIRSAYAWLAVGSLFMFLQGIEQVGGVDLVPAPNAAPVLHILTLGFATNVIFGMGVRMLPLFEGSEIPWHRALDLAFLALNGGVILRVAGGLVDLPAGEAVLALSGVLALGAFLGFGACVFGAMRPAAKEAYRRRASGWGSRKLTSLQVHTE